METRSFSPRIEREFKDKKIDKRLTLEILDRFNRGEFSNTKTVEVDSIPEVDGKSILDRTGDSEYRIDRATAGDRLAEFLPEEVYSGFGRRDGFEIVFTRQELGRLGMHLLPFAAYGILNGGSASSYIDRKKNIAFSEQLFDLAQPVFREAAELSSGQPKGITPAFIHPDGSPGPSFLELKMRALLIQARRYESVAGGTKGGPLGMLPIFQMTSEYTDTAIASALQQYEESPYLKDLISDATAHIQAPLTAVQPLLAAYTHSSEGLPKQVFTEAWGKKDSLLPLPGGHGQNFAVLADIYRKLYESGKRFAYLGNIDNLGNTVDPAALALLALSGKPAAFEFSYKTPVDVKGGVLVKDSTGGLNAADIGPAISKEELARAESSGKPVLFNCATGLFDLKYLVPQLDYIARELPTRFSDQQKDAGAYSQAEQITWEILGMLEDPLILAVEKYERFLASKLLLENLMTSGVRLDHEEFPSELKELSQKLYTGLQKLLRGPYGLTLSGGKWVPQSASELTSA